MNRLKPLWHWFDDRIGISEVLSPLAKHLVPPDLKWSYVFGSATLFCFILQVITGVSLSLMYQPTSQSAYASLQYITNEVTLGGILRAIHFYGASAMILLLGIHMIRVYITASYKYPREMGWISGVILLGLTILMGFTGQLLRWDNNGVWSAVVAAEQMGRLPIIGTWMAHFLIAGDTIGGATLSRFFAMHVFLIPALMFGLVGLHVFLVIRNGISEPPKAGRPVDPKTYRQWYHSMLERKGVPFWPDAAWRDVVFGVLVLLVILLLAVLIGPPKLGASPNPANIDANPRPDWYLLWIFALFALMPPEIESYAIAFAPLIVGAILILMPFIFNKGERSPLRRPWAIGIVATIVTLVTTFWVAGTEAPWSPNFAVKPLPEKVVGGSDPLIYTGAQLFYDKGCLYCHNISGFGGHRGPELTRVGERMNLQEITIRILNGGKNMPAFGSILLPQELDALVAFLISRKSESTLNREGSDITTDERTTVMLKPEHSPH